MRFKLVSPDEQHAAVAVVRRDIGQLLPQVPFIFQQAIADRVNSEEGKAIIIKIISKFSSLKKNPIGNFPTLQNAGRWPELN